MATYAGYFTTAGPQVLAGLVMQSESRVRVGLFEKYNGSLETTSPAYTAYGVSLGLVAGNSFDLGELTALGFEHVPTFGQPDSTNVLTSSLQILSEEQTTITMGVQQFDPRVLELAVGTGSMVEMGDARLIMVGGACSAPRRPVEIACTNIGCNAPSAVQSVLTAISAIVITSYDCACTSGLPLSDIVAGELMVMDLEWTVYPVNTLEVGRRLFNILLF